MAQYVVPDPEELLECPYDRVHMVRAKRFQYHLMKCRKNYTGKDFVTCPFNAKHEMPKPEIRHHLSMCPDRAVIEPELEYSDRKEGDLFKGCTDTPVYNEIDIPTSEDWDSEVTEGATYNPLCDQRYYSRVQFKTMDRTTLGRNQRAIVTDERLTVNQRINELNQNRGVQNEEEVDLRLPMTSSMAARPIQKQPQVQPRQQPDSSVYAFSVMAGRGRGRGMAGQRNDENTAPIPPTMPTNTNMMPVGRGMAMGAPVGVGRGLIGGYGRGSIAPPPGFCVPNINSQLGRPNGIH